MASAYMRLPDLDLRFDCAFLAQRLDHHGCQILRHLKTAKGPTISMGFATHTISMRLGSFSGLLYSLKGLTEFFFSAKSASRVMRHPRPAAG